MLLGIGGRAGLLRGSPGVGHRLLGALDAQPGSHNPGKHRDEEFEMDISHRTPAREAVFIPCNCLFVFLFRIAQLLGLPGSDTLLFPPGLLGAEMGIKTPVARMCWGQVGSVRGCRQRSPLLLEQVWSTALRRSS